jgi:hypothetical protein
MIADTSPFQDCSSKYPTERSGSVHGGVRFLWNSKPRHRRDDRTDCSEDGLERVRNFQDRKNCKTFGKLTPGPFPSAFGGEPER